MSTRFRCLHVRSLDLDATLHFYRDILRLTPGPIGPERLAFSAGETVVEFARELDLDDRMSLLHQWVAEFEVEDLAAAVRELRKHGTTFLVAGSDEHAQERAVVLDPSGHQVMLRQRAG